MRKRTIFFFVKIKSHLQRNHSHLQFIAYIQITQIIPTTMVLKKNINTKSTNKSSSSTSKIKKKAANTTSSKLKSKSKSTKIKIDKLNNDISQFTEVQNLLATNDNKQAPKKTRALDSIKEDLQKDEELKKKNKLAENDLNKQLELLTEMGL